MHYIVCIKQVPDTADVEIDRETGVLKRDGVVSVMNVYDTYALEAAVRLKEAHGGTVTVLSMGPPQAAAIIKEAYSLGADRGYLLSDRQFAGADTLATSYALAEAIKMLPSPRLIFCGMQTTDGDTAQVGPGVAELLDVPHLSCVTRIDSFNPSHIVVTADMGDGWDTVRITLPCLLTVTAALNTPRLPSYRRRQSMADIPVTVWTAADLPHADPNRLGLHGSPTQVERIFPPPAGAQRTLVTGSSAHVSRSLYDKLKELKFV